MYLQYIQHNVNIFIEMESTHSKVDAPSEATYLLLRGASPVCRQERHFYFRLFLFSRKVSNAMSKPPKDVNKDNIPKKTIIVSYAVINITSLLCILANQFQNREVTTLSWVLSVIIFYQTYVRISTILLTYFTEDSMIIFSFHH